LCLAVDLYRKNLATTANMFSSTFAALVALAVIPQGAIAACNQTALLQFADSYVFAHENGYYPGSLNS
jgi:hypothetical protein